MVGGRHVRARGESIGKMPLHAATRWSPEFEALQWIVKHWETLRTFCDAESANGAGSVVTEDCARLMRLVNGLRGVCKTAVDGAVPIFKVLMMGNIADCKSDCVTRRSGKHKRGVKLHHVYMYPSQFHFYPC